MYLQLAENGQRKRRTISIPGYKRKSNFVPAHKRMLSEGIKVDNPMIYIPSFLFNKYGYVNPIPGKEGMFIKESFFDELEPAEWHALMRELERYQPSGLSEGLGDRKKRKADREAKKQLKKDKKEAKKITKSVDKAEKKAKRKETAKNIGGIMGTVLKGVAGALVPGMPNPESSRPGAPDEPADDEGDDKEEKPWYKKTSTWVIAGASVIVIGGIAYAVTTSNKNKQA
jgi:hypothetical protein